MDDTVRITGRGLGAALCVVLLSGCALLTPSKPLTTFDLEGPASVRRSGAAKGVLVVPEPTALRSLESDKIAVKPGPTVVSYYGESQWSDRLPRLVQTRTIQAFEKASRLTSVGRPSDGLTPDYQLVMDIRAFELVISPAPTAVVELTAKLVNVREGKAPAAKVFRASAPATGDKVEDAVAALDSALAKALRDLVAWATRVI